MMPIDLNGIIPMKHHNLKFPIQFKVMKKKLPKIDEIIENFQSAWFPNNKRYIYQILIGQS